MAQRALDPQAPDQDRPLWRREVDALLARAIPRLSVIGACTPRNLAPELEALEADFMAGRPRPPSFVYGQRPRTEWVDAVGSARDAVADAGPWGRLYADRLHELWLEGRIAINAGTDALEDWAVQRYARRDDFHDAADALCARWLDEPRPAPPSRTTRSDDERDPASLVSRLRAEVGRRRLPFRVEVAPRLSALAATGPDVIFVAPGRAMSDEATRRTVLHEVQGHAMPRANAKRRGGLFSLGTAHGSDDQEGRALRLEAEAGLLGPARRRELALRHRACALTREGADFVTVARALSVHTDGWPDALRIAARAQRGAGIRGGLARESVYLPAFLRIDAHIEADPAIDAWLREGQISTDSLPVLRALCPTVGASA